MISSVTDAEHTGERLPWDLHVLTLALETLESELDAATDPSEHREITERIRLLTAHIDRLLGVGPLG